MAALLILSCTVVSAIRCGYLVPDRECTGSTRPDTVDSEIFPALAEDDVSFRQDLPEKEKTDDSRKRRPGKEERQDASQDHQRQRLKVPQFVEDLEVDGILLR